MAVFEFTGQLVVELQSLLRLRTPQYQSLPGLFFEDGRPHNVQVEFTMIPATAQLELLFRELGHTSAAFPGPDLSDNAARNIAITITKADGTSVSIVGTGADRTDPYDWTASNGPEVIAFTAGMMAGDTITLRLAYLEYHLEIDWQDDGLYDHSLSDVTHDLVTRIDTFRGRDYGSMIYGRSVAGRMNFELTNHHGHYERFNPASPLQGLVAPQRRVRLWIEGAAQKQHHRLWTGRVDRFVPKERRGGADVTSVIAYGLMSRLTQRTVSVPYQTAISTGDAMEDILENAGLSSSEIGDMDGTRTMARFWSRPQNAIQAARQVEETEGGFLHETSLGTMRFEDSQYRIRGARMMPSARLTDNRDPMGEIPITFVKRDDPVKDIANIVQVPVNQFTVTANRLLWELETPIQFNVNETRVFVVEYPNARTPTDIVSIVSFQTPATGTDFRLTQNQDGTGNLRAGSVTAEQTGDGLLLTVTTGATGAWLTTLRVRGSYLELEDPIVIQLRDADSIDEFGPRTYPVPAQFISEVRDAESYGQFLLDITKDTQSKIRAGFNINNHIDTSLALDLSSRVALTTRETGGDMYIEAVENHIDLRAQRHDMTLTLFPAIAFFSDVIALDVGPGLDTGVLGR